MGGVDVKYESPQGGQACTGTLEPAVKARREATPKMCKARLMHFTPCREGLVWVADPSMILPTYWAHSLFHDRSRFHIKASPRFRDRIFTYIKGTARNGAMCVGINFAGGVRGENISPLVGDRDLHWPCQLY